MSGPQRLKCETDASRENVALEVDLEMEIERVAVVAVEIVVIRLMLGSPVQLRGMTPQRRTMTILDFASAQIDHKYML